MARLRRLDHEVFITQKPHTGPEQWCKNRFGSRWDMIDNPQGIWTVFWAGRDNPRAYRWCFADEKDAMLFALRWV